MIRHQVSSPAQSLTGQGAEPTHGKAGRSGGWLRRGTAFAASAEQRTRLTSDAVTADIVLAAAATVAVLIVTAKSSGPQLLPITIYRGVPIPGQTIAGPSGAPMAILALTTAPLALRRVRPLTAFWVIVGAAAAAPHYAANVITLGAIVFAAYSAVMYSRFRGAAIISTPAAGLLDVIYLHSNPSSSLPPTGVAILAMFPMLIAANTIHQWRRQASESKARLLRLEAEHEEATRQVLKQERARIASELHDVVTHNVSVMIVQAGAARQVLADSPAQARAALLAVESSGRAAMAELRHLLGLLAPADGGEPGRFWLQPQPGVGQLTSLVDRVRAAGLPVDLRASGEPRDLPAGVDLAAYRVVQEALTNVLRHAGKPPTTVSVGYRDDDVVVQVTDAGRPMPAVGPASAPGSGRGLVGLRERAELYGGELTAGALPAGGWQVTARFPACPAELVPARLPATVASLAAGPEWR